MLFTSSAVNEKERKQRGSLTKPDFTEFFPRKKYDVKKVKMGKSQNFGNLGMHKFADSAFSGVKGSMKTERTDKEPTNSSYKDR